MRPFGAQRAPRAFFISGLSGLCERLRGRGAAPEVAVAARVPPSSLQVWRDLTSVARVQFLYPDTAEPVDLDMRPLPAEVTPDEPLANFWCVVGGARRLG